MELEEKERMAYVQRTREQDFMRNTNEVLQMKMNRQEEENTRLRKDMPPKLILNLQERKNIDFSQRGDLDNNLQSGELPWKWTRFVSVTNPIFSNFMNIGPDEIGGNQVSIQV